MLNKIDVSMNNITDHSIIFGLSMLLRKEQRKAPISCIILK